MKKDTKEPKKYHWFYIAGLVVIFIAVFTYIFNEKIDLNGDNCDYYMLATSITSGHGYANIATPNYEPSGVFPPGYPLLMSIIRIFSDSIIAQKILNGLFLLASTILLFIFIRKNKFPDSLAFLSCCAILFNARILHFSTMMMSEMSYILFSVFALWTLYKLIDDEKPFWKNAWFYLLILSSAYAYHIRTQGITLAAAIICYLLVTKKWKQTIGFIAGFGICLLPWIIRNKLADVGQSRYMSQILQVSQHRPEEGMLDAGGVIMRFFDTCRMLMTKALPNTIMPPYLDVDYNAATTFGEWIIGIILLAVIVYGFWQFGKLKYFFIFYALANFGIISLFNDPGQNRYITTLIPFLQIGVFVGLYTILLTVIKKTKIAKGFSPWFMAILFIFFSFSPIKAEHEQNKAPFPANYQNFFKIAEEVKKQLPPQTMICSRKPNLFYMYGKTWVCNYRWTNDDKELINNLIQNKVDYVVLEQLGYSSTFRYLLPAIEKHEELFIPVMHLPNPDTYLLKFEREAAARKMAETN
jgi:hypothetical protein